MVVCAGGFGLFIILYPRNNKPNPVTPIAVGFNHFLFFSQNPAGLSPPVLVPDPESPQLSVVLALRIIAFDPSPLPPPSPPEPPDSDPDSPPPPELLVVLVVVVDSPVSLFVIFTFAAPCDTS